MNRVFGFASGAAAFGAAHAIETARWRAWFGGVHDPWFLNSAPAAGFTLGCVLLASLGVAMFTPSRPVRGITIACGAASAMAVVLFTKPGGAGTIFPVVLAFGAAALLMSATLGAWIGREARGAL